MLPLRDENPTFATPWATYALIGLNLLAWVALQGLGVDPALGESICRYGYIPGDVLGTAAAGSAWPIDATRVCVIDGNGSWLSVASSMFMHGGWFHILGNLWFLWIFGDNVEDAMGSVRFVVFYLLCGVAAAAAQTMSAPDSTVPMVGASGAIGGVMGAYALLYPKARVHMLIFLGFFVTTAAVPAVLMLGYWIIVQLLGGVFTPTGGGGVAFWAHIGGFAAGLALVLPFRNPARLARHLAQTRRRTARHRW